MPWASPINPTDNPTDVQTSMTPIQLQVLHYFATQGWQQSWLAFAIVTKLFELPTGPRAASASCHLIADRHYFLAGTYDVEGVNLLSGCTCAIPLDATADEAKALAQRWVESAQKIIDAVNAAALGGAPFAGSEVVGVDADGELIQWDASTGKPYNCGMSLQDFGRHLLEPQELQRVDPGCS